MDLESRNARGPQGPDDLPGAFHPELTRCGPRQRDPVFLQPVPRVTCEPHRTPESILPRRYDTLSVKTTRVGLTSLHISISR